MQREILSAAQKKLLPLLKEFHKEYYLAGGTAIALQIGHRRSIDFDLFREKDLSHQSLENFIKRKNYKIQNIFKKNRDEFTLMVDNIKISFISFPFHITANDSLDNIIKIPKLLTLAAMKGYALGRRAKWKDYVDMYFIMRDFFSLDMIASEAEKIFQGSFNSRIFREQLIWFENMDYSEKLEFMPGYQVSDEEIKIFLLDAVRR